MVVPLAEVDSMMDIIVNDSSEFMAPTTTTSLADNVLSTSNVARNLAQRRQFHLTSHPLTIITHCPSNQGEDHTCCHPIPREEFRSPYQVFIESASSGVEESCCRRPRKAGKPFHDAFPTDSSFVVGTNFLCHPLSREEIQPTPEHPIVVVPLGRKHETPFAIIDQVVDLPRKENPAEEVVCIDYELSRIPCVVEDRPEHQRDSDKTTSALTVCNPESTTTFTGLQLLCDSIPQQNQVLKSPIVSIPTNPCAPLPRRYKSDLVVVLDMDECLIHSTFFEPGEPITPAPALIDSFTFTMQDGQSIRVHKRPFVDKFLRQVTSRFETHVFTAATKSYADLVLDGLDPTGTMFTKRWYRPSCSYDAGRFAYVKNLNRIVQTDDLKLSRIVLVDNNTRSFIANPSNGILIPDFHDDPQDKDLLTVWDLLQILDTCGDVRPILEESYKLCHILQKV